MMNGERGSRHQADTDGHVQVAFDMYLMQKSICTKSSFMVVFCLYWAEVQTVKNKERGKRVEV